MYAPAHAVATTTRFLAIEFSAVNTQNHLIKYRARPRQLQNRGLLKGLFQSLSLFTPERLAHIEAPVNMTLLAESAESGCFEPGASPLPLVLPGHESACLSGFYCVFMAIALMQCANRALITRSRP